MNVLLNIKKWLKKIQIPLVIKINTNIENLKSELQIKYYKLNLNSNNFLDNRVVIYFERTSHPVINEYISNNFKKLQDSFNAKGLSLINVSLTSLLGNTKDSKDELIQYLRYKYPNIFNASENEVSEMIDIIIDEIDIQLYNNVIGDLLGLPAECSPCFIHSVDLTTENNAYRKWEYSCFLLNSKDISLLDKQIQFYLAHTEISSENIFFALKEDNELEYDADERFEFDGSNISPEINEAIRKINNITNEKLLLRSMLYLIESLKNSNPLVCEKISQSLLNKIETSLIKPSRLIIDEKFRIWLPDYNSVEIEMTPLPKAFYIFMLKHPEGISFKNLSDYKSEILNIYTRIANRYDLEKIKQSISEIVDIRSNSVNEKCSRIKEAFLSKIDDDIAKNYYITGGRNQLKLIELDRSLIQFPHNL